MASKNMRSEGYIQFPDALSAPVSFSLFAGRSVGTPGVERGIVLISRSVPRRAFERRPVVVGAGEDVDWSRVEESHDCWTGEEEDGVATVGVACVGGGAEV